MFERKFKLGLVIAALLFAIPTSRDSAWAQGKIRIFALPSRSTPNQGEVVAVPILVDMSATDFRLGAMTAGLQWDTAKLAFEDFAPGTTEGFSEPVVNTQKTAEGKLLFASINAKGAAAQVNVLTLRLRAKVDLTTWPSLKLDLPTLASAESFVDLVPLVEKVVTGVKVAENRADLPATFALFQNVPNPFNPATLIRYELPQRGNLVLTIYNLTGQKIKTLAEGDKPAGRYTALWNGKDDRDQNLASGIYFYRLEVHAVNGEKFVATRKMSLLR